MEYARISFVALLLRRAGVVARDLFRVSGVELEELQPEYQPQLAEIGWSGLVVDVSTREGVVAAGFAEDYPRGAGRRETQKAAAGWYADGAEGVVSRSASVGRVGFAEWAGPHEAWSEVTIFVENAARRPELLRRRADLDWLK